VKPWPAAAFQRAVASPHPHELVAQPSPSTLGLASDSLLFPGVFTVVAEAGRSLRERSAPRSTRSSAMWCNFAPSRRLEGFEGTVVVKADVAGTPCRVKAILGKDDYPRACNAHRDGKRVRIAGSLRRDAKTYELLQPRDLQSIGSPPDQDGAFSCT